MKRKAFVKTSFLSLFGGASLFDFSKNEDRFRSVKFGIVTDIHYADKKPHGNRYYKESLDKLSECVDVMNREKVDFLVELGDFKDTGSPPDANETLGFLETVEKEFNRFNGPCYHVLGNHDEDSISKKQFLNRITNGSFPKAKNYYAFDKNALQFIVLDANFTSEGVAYNKGNFDWKDTFIPQDQLEWLKEKLQKNTSPTVVFIHQRLDSFQFVSTYCPNNADKVRELLENSGNVLAVFQGHYHWGAINTINDIPYYTLRGLIEGSGLSNNSFAIVEIEKNFEKEFVVRVNGYRKATSVEFG